MKLRGDLAMTPPYPLRGHEESVALHEGEGLLEQGGLEVRGKVSVSLSWTPTPSITFELEGDLLIQIEVGVDATLSLLDIPDAPAARVSVNHHALDRARGSFRDSFSFGSDRATSVSFLVPNLPDIHGGVISTATGSWAGRVDLLDSPWRVRLDSRHDISAIVRDLKSGGFAATHVGRIDRTDGSSFSSSDAIKVVEGLRQFLSFARGFWTSPLLLVGYQDDLPVWHEWCARHASPWRTNFAWSSPHHPDSLATAFPLFMERWRVPDSQDKLVLGIGWFIEANQLSNLESAIILGQVALELFASAVLVDEQERLSRREFKDGPTDKTIRELLDWASIPLAIPAKYQDLADLADREGWADGPATLVGYRNLLVHPRDRLRRILDSPTSARAELSQLTLWYVELIILRFCGYEGDYSNRITARVVGEVESVPWASTAR
jgi:hypothetical protein